MVDSLTLKLITEAAQRQAEETVKGSAGMQVVVEIADLEGDVKVTKNNETTKLSFKGKYKIKQVDWLKAIGATLEYDSNSNRWTGGGQADVMFGKHWKLEGQLKSDGNATTVGMTLIFRYE